MTPPKAGPPNEPPREPGENHGPFAGLFGDDPGQSGDQHPVDEQPEPAGPPAKRQPRSRREARQAREAASENVPHPNLPGDEPEAHHDSFAWGNEAYPQREARPPRRHNRTGLWATLIGVLVLAAMVVAAVVIFQPQLAKMVAGPEPTDYIGSGHGKVVIRIVSGDGGSAIAKTLQKDGVVKTSGAFYQELLDQDPQPTFYPGSYQLKKKMSARAALTALTDPHNKVSAKVTIPEGTTLAGILQIVHTATGISMDKLQAASKDLASMGVPATEPSLEGYLYPATYEFDPSVSAQGALKRMVTEMYSRLAAAGVAPADRHKVLTLASIIQKEGGSNSDFYKVSRVFTNRLDQGMKLQSDATVSYGAHSSSISTSDKQRSDASNKYNTYAHLGLPIGPIANPGAVAIDAALHPAPGPWLYFVLVNGDTGQTVFSTTYAEHEVAVKQWQTWSRAHPDFGK